MVMKKQISIQSFFEKYPDDESCYRYLAEQKWKDGFSCQKCGCNEYGKGYTLYARRCKSCRYDESVTANTMFHKCKFGIHKAFMALFRIGSKKKGISSTELSNEIDVNQKTAWLFRRKAQQAMKSKSPVILEGQVDIDEFGVGGHRSNMQGRSLEGKKHAQVAVEVKDGGRMGRAYALAIADFTTPSLRRVFDWCVHPMADVRVDGFYGYRALMAEYPNMGYELSDGGENFKEIHLVILNMKNWLRGIHHHCSKQHFENYLDEFFYRFNRRGKNIRKNILGNLINRFVSSPPLTYKGIAGLCGLSG